MFINIPGISIVLVANAAERLALVPVDGTIAEQLDDNSVYAYNQPSNTWVPVGSGGGGGVSSVSNLDGSLTISPTTGAVIASLSNSGVTAGTYLVTGATIDAQGRVTSAQENYYLTIVNALIFG